MKDGEVTETNWIPADIQARGIERRLRAGETLFRMGKRPVGLYEIVSGTVRLVRVDRAGKEAVLFIGHPGETIAEASLFSSRYHCDAIAMTDAVVRLYPKAAVLAAFDRDARTMQAFAATLAHQVMILRTRLEQRSIHSARERVRHHLAINVGPDRRTIVLPGTLKQLAGELGLSHETLYRTLAEMAEDGEIERRKGTIRLTRSV
jgi:CRP-like cAMP-binding protein